ncbi:molybdopterin-dependent oxidoreductase [Arcobacter arenosus]|uniref:molybdopterin-dependent oxidoreductase n=1 Tax=Arcobacter arenosus TaxID=2576037 RepID=UPI003BAB7C02
MNLNNLNTIACPLDCFDTCEAILDGENIKANKEHPITKSKLCVNFANLLKEDFLENAFINKQKINLDESLDFLIKKLEETEPKKVLYYKGAGNLGVMQSSPKSFFAKYGATLTKGSLCDGAGDEGISLGRGFNINPPIENLIDSDIIIVWGRNLSVTSPHMYNLIKDKTFITIDPVKTKIAKKSEIHFQINPKTDHELALLFTRFAYMEDLEDEEFIQNNSSGAEDFFELAKERPIVSYEATTGISLSDVSKMFELIKGKSVSILLGIGPQKYYEGANIFRAIDSFAAFIGLHNKNKGGVWYLSDSNFGYEKKFQSQTLNKVDLPEVDFSKYDLVFIQGANPVVSAPNTKRVIEGLKNSFVIFFGTTFNDTCEYADVIIPSSNFKTKKDVRLSYGHEFKAISNNIENKNTNTISEYELTKYLFEQFDFEDLISEDEAVNYYKNLNPKRDFHIENFNFLEDLEVDNLYEDKDENQFYLLFGKRKENLNSQFESDNYLYLNSKCGFDEGDEVKASTSFGEANFIVKLDDDIKENCIVLYAGNKKANYLTNYKSDELSSSAVFQEALVRLELL